MRPPRKCFYLALILGLLVLGLGALRPLGRPFYYHQLPLFVPQTEAQRLLCFQPLSLNRAREEELVLVPGIGPSLARAIVSLRQKEGRIDSLSRLKDIKGIGPKKLARLESYLKVP